MEVQSLDEYLQSRIMLETFQLFLKLNNIRQNVFKIQKCFVPRLPTSPRDVISKISWFEQRGQRGPSDGRGALTAYPMHRLTSDRDSLHRLTVTVAVCTD